jgi:glc operon protein GlcG
VNILRREQAMRYIARTIVAMLLLNGAATAQTREARVLTLEGARRIAAAAEAEAQRRGWSVTIAVVDAAGELLYLQRADDAASNTADFALAKARTAARFRRPTRALDSVVAGGRPHLLAIDGALPIEGGLPIEFDGRVIGGVGVSGATSAQDGLVARAGLTGLAH